jgi:tetratricopeptide (TPR) repeat protein
LESRGSEIFRSTPFYPVLHLFDRLLGAPVEHGPEGRRGRLRRLLASAGVHDGESMAAVGEFLGMDPGTPGEVDVARAAERRARHLRTLVELVGHSVRRWPGVIVLEDLHWVDPSTLELVEALVESLVEAPVLMIGTTRPEFRGAWPLRHRHAVIALGRLGRSDLCTLIKSTGAGDALSLDTVESIADRASGIPLFAEELARAASTPGTVGRSEIPESLAASLTARLDRVGPAREIAQMAAVCGDEVAPDVLSAVARRSPDQIEPLLERLIEAEILVTHPRPTGRILAFPHSLLRDVVYETLLRSQRRDLHARVADAIVEGFPALANGHPEVVARHLAWAGQHRRAAEGWHRASGVAISRGAYREAEEACRAALTSLDELPPTPEHAGLQVSVQNALVSVLQVTQGYSATITAEASARARELAEHSGSVEDVMMEVAGRWAALSSAGRYVAARQVADQFLELARGDGGREALASAHMMQMTSRYRLGDLVGAERQFERAEPLFAEASFAQRLGAVAQTYGTAARNAWMLGRPDDARRRMDHALAVAQTSNSPYDLAFSRYMAAILAVLMREAEKARRLAEQAMDLADRTGFPQFAAISRVALGRALVEVSPSEAAVDLIETGMAGMSETGSRVAMTMYLGWLAEAQGAVGSLQAAMAAIDRALRLNPEELFFRPELLRIRGELRRLAGDVKSADNDMRAALTGAADMGALSLELRAAMSLHRLRGSGGGSGATAIVAAVYGRFREGQDAVELEEAGAVVRRAASREA